MFDDRWDKQTDAWKDDGASPLTALKNFLLPGNGTRPASDLAPGEPTLLETHKLFTEDVLAVIENNDAGVIMIRIEMPDPLVAAAWANALIDQLNAEIRQGVIAESERSIGYLREQIETTSLSGLQTVMYSVIEEHTKNITLAKANEDYALKIIDPAVVPDDSIRPNRRLMVVVGFLAGLLIGALVSFRRDFVERSISQ